MARKKPERLDRAAIVTIHGTGDTAAAEDGDKWWQRGSAFAQQLVAAAKAQGVEADIVPFVWCGSNSAVARERAALALVKFLGEESARRPAVHVVAHSHGGNVANDAVTRMGLPEVVRAASPVLRLIMRRQSARIASVTTVGTPFFRSRLDRVQTFRPYIAFLLAFVPAMVALAALAGAAFALIDPTGDISGGLASSGRSLPEWRRIFWSVIAFSCLTLAAAGFIVRFAFAEYLVQMRLAFTQLYQRYRSAALVRIHAIWHPNDEAIAFLQKVEALHLEPLARGAMLSRSRRGAIVSGVRFAIFILLVAPVLGLVFGAAVAGAKAAGVALPVWAPFASLFQEAYHHVWPWPLVFGLIAVAAGPIAFGLAYCANRLCFGLLPETLRPHINGFVGGTLVGMAFGRDGVETIGAVEARSHNLETDEVVLADTLADRMRVNSAEAANRLIEKYRWTLFTVGADSKADISAMATDAMTWDSLIHTTYFDQPEIAYMIARHIAAPREAPA